MTNEIVERFTDAIQAVGIDAALQLPCDRVAPLLESLTGMLPYFTLTREEDGVGITAGIALADAKPLMVVQSSGIGNMVNALMSLTKFYQLPLPVLVSHRGIYKEGIAAQVPMGANLERVLAAMGVDHQSYSELTDVADLSQDLEQLFQEKRLKCYLLSPKLFEGIPKGQLTPSKTFGISQAPGTAEEQHLVEKTVDLRTRFDIFEALKEFLHDKAVICNMGFPSRELYSILDQSSNFYMQGSLGLVSSIGLGAALFTKKEVVVLDGDGSLLMNPNAMLSIGALQPKNLTIICVDNGAYGSTGNQPTFTAQGFKLDELARASGIRRTLVTSNPDDSSKLPGPGPRFIRLLARPGNAQVGIIKLSHIENKIRFMNWLQSE